MGKNTRSPAPKRKKSRQKKRIALFFFSPLRANPKFNQLSAVSAGQDGLGGSLCRYSSSAKAKGGYPVHGEKNEGRGKEGGRERGRATACLSVEAAAAARQTHGSEAHERRAKEAANEGRQGAAERGGRKRGGAAALVRGLAGWLTGGKGLT